MPRNPQRAGADQLVHGGADRRDGLWPEGLSARTTHRRSSPSRPVRLEGCRPFVGPGRAVWCPVTLAGTGGNRIATRACPPPTRRDPICRGGPVATMHDPWPHQGPVAASPVPSVSEVSARPIPGTPCGYPTHRPSFLFSTFLAHIPQFVAFVKVWGTPTIPAPPHSADPIPTFCHHPPHKQSPSFRAFRPFWVSAGTKSTSEVSMQCLPRVPPSSSPPYNHRPDMRRLDQNACATPRLSPGQLACSPAFV